MGPVPATRQARLLAARAVLWTEALAVAAWPALSLLAGLAALALFGAPVRLPWALHLAVLLACLSALGWLLLRAVRDFHAPGPRAAERRLERDSGLRHRPFDTLLDRPAGGGAATGADGLWALHRARAEAGLATLRLAAPHADLPRHDGRALRVACALLLAAGLVVAGPRAGDRLGAALWPGLPAWLQAGPPPAVQAWIQPPAYTGLPPVFLPPGGAPPGAPVTVPAGSRLTLGVTGLASRPSLSLAGHALRLDKLGADSFQATAALTQGGRLRLAGRFSTLAGWTLALLPNEAPTVVWAAPPARAGTSLSTRLPWRVAQRWGVARLEAVMQPKGRRDLPARHIPLPLPGTPRQAAGEATQDMSADPYAGVAMTARLEAQDVSGQHGQSEAAEIVLPARPFRHPLARAVADLRRRIALHPEARGEAADELGALAEAPLAQPVPGLPAAGIALNLSAAAALLGAPHATPAEIDQVQARLWTLALALDGALPDASARALAEAREDLRRGIEDHAKGRLSDKALSQRLDALRQALDKRLADLAGRAMRQGALQKFDPQTQHLSAPGIDRLVRKLEQALRAGRMDEARQRMAELERMMDQLKNAHIMTQEEQRQQQEQARRGRAQMGAVQDLAQREAALLDHAQRRGGAASPPPFAPPPPIPEQLQLGQLGQSQDGGTEDQTADPPPFASPPFATPPLAAPQPTPPAAQPPSGAPDQKTPGAATPPPPPSRAQDARTQRALRRALGALKDGLAQAGRKPPPSLGDADRAMQDAAAALAGTQDAQARDAIGRAIAALQQGGQDMSRQGGAQGGQGGSAGLQLSLQPGGQSNGPGEEEGQDDSGDGQGGQKRDPFGRKVDGGGTTADDPGLRVPDEMERGRSQAIQEELRRRGADRQRPRGELDYIGRLLKPF
jgi:uncharacterized protein (TIGR02302 family)